MLQITTQAAILMVTFAVLAAIVGSWTVSGPWRTLGVRFPAPDEPVRGEQRFRFSSLRMTRGFGGSYRGCITIGVSDRGISLEVWAPLRLFHPGLLIPWSAIRSCEPKDLMWHKGRQVDLGDGDGFWIQGKAAEEVGRRWQALQAA